MDLTNLKLFFENYSVSTIIIAFIVMVIKLIVEKYFKNKLPKYVFTVIPIALTMAIDLSVNMIFIEKAFTISTNSLYSALLAGVLSTSLTALTRRVISGKKITLDKTTLFLEELLHSYSESCDNYQLATDIKTILDKENVSNNDKEQEITIILKEHLIEVSELEVYSVVKIIMESISKNN